MGRPVAIFANIMPDKLNPLRTEQALLKGEREIFWERQTSSWHIIYLINKSNADALLKISSTMILVPSLSQMSMPLLVVRSFQVASISWIKTMKMRQSGRLALTIPV